MELRTAFTTAIALFGAAAAVASGAFGAGAPFWRGAAEAETPTMTATQRPIATVMEPVGPRVRVKRPIVPPSITA